MLPPAVLLFDPGFESLRLARGWAWVWEMPGPLPWCFLGFYPVAAALVLPDLPALWRWRQAACITIAAGALLLWGFGLLLAGASVYASRYEQRRIVHLEDPGVYERAAIVAHGHSSLHAWLWAKPRGGGSWQRVSEPLDYPPCTWPLEVRKAEGKSRYLLVDSEGRASALLDLSRTPFRPYDDWQVDGQLPPIEDLRREFGEDLTALADDWEY
jgi:hypothetical protein